MKTEEYLDGSLTLEMGLACAEQWGGARRGWGLLAGREK